MEEGRIAAVLGAYGAARFWLDLAVQQIEMNNLAGGTKSVKMAKRAMAQGDATMVALAMDAMGDGGVA